LGDELKKLDVAVDLLVSSGGVYEVVADGKLLFSKKALGRFPEEGEIVSLIQKKG
jgi:selenoprotein W-related protein